MPPAHHRTSKMPKQPSTSPRSSTPTDQTSPPSRSSGTSATCRPVTPAQWDAVPAGGNVLTPREYQRRWLDTYDRILARSDGAESTPDATIPAGPSPGTCFGGSIAPIVEGWSLPGPTDLLVANPSVITQPHHDYAAWDWIIPTNTPIYAIHDGTVIRVHQWQNNWWEQRLWH